MGTIDPALIKFYAAVSTTGGGIDVAALQTSSVIGNETGRITKLERTTGVTRYFKQFIRNENAETWGPIQIYLADSPKASPDTEFGFALTGSKSRLTTASALSGTATFAPGGIVYTSADLRTEVRVGELVFNSTDDSSASGVAIQTIVATMITLASAYMGATGSGKSISVCPATTLLYVSPLVPVPEVEQVTLAQNESVGIWKQYRVLPGARPYSSDGVTMIFEEVS